MATVTFDKATRIYPGNERPAVDHLDLEIGDGEFLVLVGPSGCGKSTSLRMLAGLEDVDEGAIRIDDRDVTHLPPKARDIAMVFQNYALYPHMSVYENMAFALKLRKTSKDEIDRRVKEAAALLQLEEYLGRKPKALSGGQRQRVAMGRAIVREPQVFLMDEPLSNLDAKLRVQTRTQIASLQAKLGITTVYVTHDQVEAMTMGHRVAVMLDGVLQQVDTPRALYDTPANVFVAGFMGSPAMNIKTVPLHDDGANFAELIVPLTREQVAEARTEGGGDTVTVGFPAGGLRHRQRRRGRHAARRGAGRGPRFGRQRLRPRRDRGRLGAVRGSHRPAQHADHGRHDLRQAAYRPEPRLPRRHRPTHLTRGTTGSAWPSGARRQAGSTPGATRIRRFRATGWPPGQPVAPATAAAGSAAVAKRWKTKLLSPGQTITSVFQEQFASRTSRSSPSGVRAPSARLTPSTLSSPRDADGRSAKSSRLRALSRTAVPWASRTVLPSRA